MEFEGAGYSFYFVINFEVLEGDPGFSSWGKSVHVQLRLLFLSRNHTGNYLQQVSPFELVVVLLLLKFCLVCISRLGVIIVEIFLSSNGTQMPCLILLVYGRSFWTNIWHLARRFVVL